MGALADFISREFSRPGIAENEETAPATLATSATHGRNVASVASVAGVEPETRISSEPQSVATVASVADAGARNSDSSGDAVLTAFHVAEQIRANADRRNAEAMRIGTTDRFCTVCGDYAAAEWPMSRFRSEWRCPRCAPVDGKG